MAAVALQLPGPVEFGRCRQLNNNWRRALMNIIHLAPQEWWWTLWRARVLERFDDFPILRSLFDPVPEYTPLTCTMQRLTQNSTLGAVALDAYEFTIQLRPLDGSPSVSTFVWSGRAEFHQSECQESLKFYIGTIPDWIQREEDTGMVYGYTLSIKVSSRTRGYAEYFWLQNDVDHDYPSANSAVPLRPEFAKELAYSFDVDSNIIVYAPPDARHALPPYLSVSLSWQNVDHGYLDTLSLSETLFYFEEMAPWATE